MSFSLGLYLSGFLGCAVIIFFAGRKLSYYGNSLAEKTGWGKAWVGLILMASVTSLPELTVGISAAAIVQSADLAVGDVLGSCAFNLGILALMDAFVPKHRHIFAIASPSHIMAAALGIILLVMIGFGLLLNETIVVISWIGLTSVIFIVIYFISIRLMFLNEKRYLIREGATTYPPAVGKEQLSHRQIVFRFTIYAIIIVLTGLTLPFFAEHIAELTGLKTSFVGTLFLAGSTSLPEIAVSLAAVRMGAIDLSVGNLLGSNIFNIFTLAINDIFYTKGHILKDASQNNLISVFSAILMSAVVIIGLTYRTEGKRYKLAWDAALIFMIYIINMILLYNTSL